MLKKQKSTSPKLHVKKRSVDARKQGARSPPEQNLNIKKILSLNKFFREKTSLGLEHTNYHKKRNHRLSLKKLVRKERSLTRRPSRGESGLPYTMVRKLGKGSYAYVYLGWHLARK